MPGFCVKHNSCQTDSVQKKLTLSLDEEVLRRKAALSEVKEIFPTVKVYAGERDWTRDDLYER